MYSLSKSDDPYEIDLDRCIEIIKIKRQIDEEKMRLRLQFPRTIGESEGCAITANIGRYGPYLSFKSQNYKIPKGVDPLVLTVEEAKDIIFEAEPKKTKSRKKKAE